MTAPAMPNFHPAPPVIRRPKLLIRAARFGLDSYNRTRDLKRVLRLSQPPVPRAALTILIEEEARMEDNRRAGDGSYNVARHVELLIALMAELRALFGSRSAGDPLS